ncbi:amino acid adenylation domain-containing protein [Streptomyces sp. NBC_00988]|uniref:non-ribosomal peptide synthetase n=1 Tax=Streptomyces sp. NBC_00988 TaxID=2903704 RepID=UPI003863FF88|nr:amino acid adenylation domain-containing protein [Streptomyces sp. NBC_00988]
MRPFALTTDEDRRRLPAEVTDAYPLSMVQAGMLVEMRAADHGPLYHALRFFPVREERPFDAASFDRAVSLLTERHPALRTSMDLTGFSRPLHLVHATARVPVAVHDLRRYDDNGRARALTEFTAERRATPFVPAEPPLLRFDVHLESDRAWRLTVTYCGALFAGPDALCDELLGLYGSLRDGTRPPAAPPSEPDHADCVAAELVALADPETLAHWRRITAAYVPLVLPEAWADPDGPVERYRLQVPFADLSDRLRALADLAGTSLRTVLLAAHLKVLGSLTAEDAFHTGVACHDALDLPGAERVLGLRLNTLPFPHDGLPADWLRLVRQTAGRERELRAHRRCPLPAIQRAAGVDRLVTVLFDPLDPPGPAGEPMLADTEFALQVTVVGDRLDLATRTDAIGRNHAGLLTAMYRQVLASMASDPEGDATAAPVPWPTPAQDDATTTGAPPALCVHQAFEEQAARTPDAVAIVFENEQLTYRELNEHANRVAHHLRALGARPDSLVGVCLERSTDLIPALLGVLKSGAGYLPLDPGNPAERIGYILEDANAPLLIADDTTAPAIPATYRGTLVRLTGTDGHPGDNPDVAVSRDDLVYVLYTSGSTGRPKGVAVPHGALATLVDAFGGLSAGPRATWLASTSVSFDISNLEIHLPLTTGGRLVLASREQAGHPDALIALVAAERVTHVQATPSGWRVLLAAGFHRPDVVALAGGEELPARLAERLRSRVGRLVNVYGPTEATVWASSWEVPAGPLRGVRLGAPLAHYRLHVLDRVGRPTAPGVPGELHIGGLGLARGYLNRPDLTAEKFVPDPYGPPGSRLYRSGDLARHLPGGSLEFLGRIDTQVKLRGYRIELGEIESALTGHPRIREAVVTLRENGLLAAHVVGSGRIDAARLRRYLGSTLPPYMIPSTFVPVDRIPLTISGKADRRALPWPEGPDGPDGTAKPPEGPLRELLAACWKDVLGTAPAGVDDEFLQAGGTSVLAVRLADRLNRELGCGIGVRTVLENPTVGRLAEAVERLRTTTLTKEHTA